MGLAVEWALGDFRQQLEEGGPHLYTATVKAIEDLRERHGVPW